MNAPGGEGLTREPRPWSQWLRRYRDDWDLTQEQLGELLGVDGKTVSAWENGQRPGRKHARTICAALQTTRVELGLVERREGSLVGRRDFLRLAAGAGTLALFGPWAGIERGDALAAERFEVATDMLERLWARVGPAATLGPALGHVELVTRLLQGSLPSAARTRLCRVLAQSSVLLALCKGWMGDPDGADHFAVIALEAARQIGDPDLAIHVVVSWTSGDRRLHNQPDVRLSRYVEGGHGFRVSDAEPATRAWAAVRAAEVHAVLGRAEPCLRALDEASKLADRAAGGRYPWPDEHWLSGESGVSLARLGRSAEARVMLSAALAQTGEERLVDQLWWTLAVARTHARGGDSEAAARLALHVVGAAKGMRHGQLEDEVARLRAELPPSAGPTVRTLDEALSIR